MQDLYSLKRNGYELKSINFHIYPDDGTCSICYSDYEILHVIDLTEERSKITFDICTICLQKMHTLAEDGRGS